MVPIMIHGKSALNSSHTVFMWVPFFDVSPVCDDRLPLCTRDEAEPR